MLVHARGFAGHRIATAESYNSLFLKARTKCHESSSIVQVHIERKMGYERRIEEEEVELMVCISEMVGRGEVGHESLGSRTNLR